MRRRTLVMAAGITATAVLTGGPAVAAAAPAAAVRARIALHFDLAQGQTPENIALAPDGTAYVTFAAARQVAAIGRDGAIRVLATLAAPADGGVHTPALGFALTSGIVRRPDGTLYFLYATGDAATTGLYRLGPGRLPYRIAALPATGLPNGLAVDERTGTFYVTDSILGTVTTVARDGRTVVWSSAPELAATAFLGANGVKVRDGAVWVTNHDQGTLLRIPVRRGRPGPVEVRARGLTAVDDFAFAGPDVIAARVGAGTVSRIDPAGRVTTLLTTADGLQNPTAVAVRGSTAYVTSAAYLTGTDPNLIVAALPRR